MKRGWAGLVLAAVLSMTGAGANAQDVDSPSVIEWRVKDRFRLWDQARSGPRNLSLEHLLNNVADAENASGVEQAMLAFLGSQPNLHRRAYWREGEETYDRDFIWPLGYRVVLSVRGEAGETCRWSADLEGFVPVERPCDNPFEMALPRVETVQGEQVRLGSPAVEVVVTPEGGTPIRTTVQVRDRLIASIGDSYASGEGNPDRPTDLGPIPRRFDAWDQTWDGRWVGRDPVISDSSEPEWWDQRCHRSFLSQHMVAALRYAAANPHVATTFLTFACSGAQTFSGVLATQPEPPGFADVGGNARLNYPQVEVLLANMCPRPPNGRSRDSTTDVERSPRYWNGQSATRWRCTGNRRARAIDALLVSIGGNDIGFAPVIQEALLPEPTGRSRTERRLLNFLRGRASTPDEAFAQIGEPGETTAPLPRNLAAIRDRLEEILPPGAPVLQTVYPNPLNDEKGAFCGPDNRRRNDDIGVHAQALTSVGAFWPELEILGTADWRSVITKGEITEIQNKLVTPLNGVIRNHVDAGRGRWQIVDAFEPAFRTRGWCAVAPTGDLQELALPNWRRVDGDDRGEWHDWAPQQWDPYASRQRLFRTPNDAALTQQPVARNRFGFGGWVLGGVLTPRQGAVLAAMSGAFHPTFEAHAIIGWSLGEALIATPLPE
jgi:hypothetical protein